MTQERLQSVILLIPVCADPWPKKLIPGLRVFVILRENV